MKLQQQWVVGSVKWCLYSELIGSLWGSEGIPHVPTWTSSFCISVFVTRAWGDAFLFFFFRQLPLSQAGSVLKGNLENGKGQWRPVACSRGPALTLHFLSWYSRHEFWYLCMEFENLLMRLCMSVQKWREENPPYVNFSGKAQTAPLSSSIWYHNIFSEMSLLGTR